MPVYNPIKPSLPRDEFRAYNKRKIFFISLSIILIVASIVILYFTFHLGTSSSTNTKEEERKEPTTQEETQKVKEEAKTAGQTYKVEAGDTLFSIGQKFGIDWHEIASVNKLKEPYTLKIGQELIIPKK